MSQLKNHSIPWKRCMYGMGMVKTACPKHKKMLRQTVSTVTFFNTNKQPTNQPTNPPTHQPTNQTTKHQPTHQAIEQASTLKPTAGATNNTQQPTSTNLPTNQKNNKSPGKKNDAPAAQSQAAKPNPLKHFQTEVVVLKYALSLNHSRHLGVSNHALGLKAMRNTISLRRRLKLSTTLQRHLQQQECAQGAWSSVVCRNFLNVLPRHKHIALQGRPLKTKPKLYRSSGPKNGSAKRLLGTSFFYNIEVSWPRVGSRSDSDAWWTPFPIDS